MKETKATVSGLTFPGALLILFIVLKLTGVVSWSWLWVLSPLWIPFAVVFVVLGFIAIAALLYGARQED